MYKPNREAAYRYRRMQQRGLGEKKRVKEESLMILVAYIAQLNLRNRESYHILVKSYGYTR